MLQNNLELIVQYPGPNHYTCRGFRGLRLTMPVYIAFDGATLNDQGVSNLLGELFCREVLRYLGTIEENPMPCSGVIGTTHGCHALSEPACRKILIRPAGTTGIARAAWISPTSDSRWLAEWGNPQWQVVPVLPKGTLIANHVPPQWRGINVAFWTKHPSECLWAVIQRAGIVAPENRLFISYVRQDTTAVADQLFEALTQQGFDVFLDRCSVPIGVQFQERLMQDISDKAVVVLLNSIGVSGSHWVGEEIAIVKTYRLGLLELRFPGGKKREDIDPDFTQVIQPADLQNAGNRYAHSAQVLTGSALEGIVERIKRIHGRALHRRRYELIDNFGAALVRAGRKAQVLPDGTFLFPKSGSRNEAVVALTPRPPVLGDFCNLHERGSVTVNRLGWLISPAPFFLAQRQAEVAWLGRMSNIEHANEGQIFEIAAKL